MSTPKPLKPWTEADEQHLAKLLERKAASEKTLRDAVMGLVVQFYYRGISDEAVVDYIIGQAEEFVTALTPFIGRYEL